jgi:hypothetical protein
MWSPTKLNFTFYDFSMIYYDFFKDSAEINKKHKKYKTAVTVATFVTVATAVENRPGVKIDCFG